MDCFGIGLGVLIILIAGMDISVGQNNNVHEIDK